MAFYRLTYRYIAVTDEEGVFTVHVQGSAGSAASLAVIAADAGSLLWQGAAPPADNIDQFVPTGVILQDVVVDELDASGKNVAQATHTLNHAGTSADEELPPQNSMACSTRTALPTRAGRGRFFLPPYAVTTVASARATGLTRTRTATACQGFIQHLSDNAFPAVVYHRGFNTGDLITSIDVGDVFDTQRRRRNALTETRTSLPIT